MTAAAIEENNEQTDDVYEYNRPAGISVSAGHTTGKVRRLFNEKRTLIRRNKNQLRVLYRASTGIDRSYPLKPLNDAKRAEQDAIDAKELLIHNSDYCKLYGKLPNLGGQLLSSKCVNTPRVNQANNFTSNTMASSSANNDNVSRIATRISNISISATNGRESSKTKAVATSTISPKSRIGNGMKTTSTPSPGSSSINNTKGNSKLVLRSKLPAPTKVAANNPPVIKSTNNVVMERKPTPPGMVSCNTCYRHFTSDRIDLHQKICSKTTKKKRKAFDIVKHRLKGTEAETIFKNKKSSKTTSGPSPTKVTTQVKKIDWRKQHEEFITNIRNAKMVKNHLDKGGKLSDLPAPPPMDTSHYLQCPHCSRKFNEAAAQRHIPKCANMLHNKPKVKAKISSVAAANSNKQKK